MLWAILVVGALICGPTPIRRALIARPLLGLFRRILPQVSQTEQEALEAGTVWWDGDLFSGKPDWNKLLAIPKPTLSADRAARFIDGPVEELCAMLNDWEITHELARSAAARLAVHQGQGLLRHDHPQGVRRARISPRSRIRKW